MKYLHPDEFHGNILGADTSFRGKLKIITWQWVAIAIVLFSSDVYGFGTIVGQGQNAEHEKITRNAMACPPGAKSDGSCFEPKSLDNLAGGPGTFGVRPHFFFNDYCVLIYCFSTGSRLT